MNTIIKLCQRLSSTPKSANNLGGTKTIRDSMLRSTRGDPIDPTSRIVYMENVHFICYS